MRRLGLLTLVVAMTLRCSADAPTEIRDEVSARLSGGTELVDGTTTGDESFFFLPPLAPDPGDAPGTFDPTLPIVVEVCRPEGGDCDPFVEPVERFSTSGRGADRVRAEDNHYLVVWKPDGGRSGDYRIQVLAGGFVFGHIDVRLDRGKRNPLTFHPNRAIPIKFRIGQNAIHLARVRIREASITHLMSVLGTVTASASSPIVVPDDSRPALVVGTNAQHDPLLLGFASADQSIDLNASTTARAIIEIVIRLAFFTVPEDDLGTRIEDDPEFSDLESLIAARASAGESFLDAVAATTLIDRITSRVVAGLPDLDEVASRALSTASVRRLFLLFVGDGNDADTAVSVSNSTFIHWKAVTRDLAFDRELDSAIVSNVSFCFFCLPPLLGGLLQSERLAGVNGIMEVEVRQDSDTSTRNAILFGAHMIGTLFDLVGIPMKPGIEEDVTKCVRDVFDIERIAAVAHADGVLPALGVAIRDLAFSPGPLVSCGKLLFSKQIQGGFFKLLGKVIQLLSKLDEIFSATNRLVFLVQWVQFGNDPPRSMTVCQENGLFADCNLRIELEPADAEIVLGDKATQFTATVTRGNGSPATGIQLEWSSPDEDEIISIYPGGATVDGKAFAFIEPLSVGSTQLTARILGLNDVVASVNITVEEHRRGPEITHVSIEPEAVGIVTGDRIQLIAQALADGSLVEEATLIWSSSDPAVATVDETGLVVGVSGGFQIEVRATADNGIFGRADVAVSKPEVQIFTVARGAFSHLSLSLGDAIALAAEVHGLGGPRPDIPVEWFSTNPNVASVEGGFVSALSVGFTEIVARARDGEDQISLEVVLPLSP